MGGFEPARRQTRQGISVQPLPQASNVRPLRILWVKVGGLWPLNTGGRLRSFHLIRELSRHHQISVITTHHPEEASAELARQLPNCRDVTSLPHASTKHDSLRFLYLLLRSWLTRLPVDLYKSRITTLEQEVTQSLDGSRFDLCVADFLVAVPNVPMSGETPVLYFSHNVEYMIWQRLGRNVSSRLRRALLALEWRKMRRFELQTCRRAGLTVAVSEQDRDRLLEGAPGSRIETIPTGVDLDYFHRSDPALEQPLEIVFTGSMDWHPNEDAMLYFLDAILPLLRSESPQVALTIVGRNPSERMKQAAAAAGVQLTGTVDDVRPFIERAAVYVVPLRIGGGTRLKIYEALAMGKAVVSTSIGAEGLPLEEGVHIVRADDPDSFARQVLKLMQNPALRQQMASAGRELMEQKYSWARVAGDFERHCRKLLP
jgi:glycosyltransferase involved in cell wall biosynthesis